MGQLSANQIETGRETTAPEQARYESVGGVGHKEVGQMDQLAGKGKRSGRRAVTVRRSRGSKLRVHPEELSRELCDMVTSLSLLGELLAEPGVLAPGHGHYLEQLQLVTNAGNRVLEKVLRAWQGDSIASLVKYRSASLRSSVDEGDDERCRSQQ